MNNKRPKALQEVWEWEERIYQETKDMSLTEYADYIREKAKEIISLYTEIKKETTSVVSP